MANKYIETTMDSEEGVTYSPSEIGEDWEFTGDTSNTTAYLLRTNRMKGKKNYKILLGVTDYFSSWVTVSFKELLAIMNPPRYTSNDDRSRNFANCKITLTYHVSVDTTMSQNYISVWPTVRRDENLTVENHWGEEE